MPNDQNSQVNQTNQATRITILDIKLDQQLAELAKLSKQFDAFQQRIDERLHHPEQGLFSRVTQTGNVTSTIIKEAESSRIILDGIASDTKRHRDVLTKFEEWIEDHERRDEDLRKSVETLVTNIQPISDDFRRRDARKPWIDKVIWLVAALVITTFVTQTGSFILKVLNLVDDQGITSDK